MTLDQFDLAKSALLSVSEEQYPPKVIIQRVGIEHTDGFIRFTLPAHGYRGKSLGLATLAVLDHIDGCDISGSRTKRTVVFRQSQMIKAHCLIGGHILFLCAFFEALAAQKAIFSSFINR